MADMIYRRLGFSGLKVSAISIGAWLTYGSDKVAHDAAEACIRKAIDSGINFIDVADIYARGQAEETVGRIIKAYDRTKLVISTKAYWPMSDDVNDRGLSRKHIMESVEKSLKRLDTDYVDIFFCHRYDNETLTSETVRAIEDLIRQGKILYWGTSMWQAEQLQEAADAADRFNSYWPVVEQPLYNMLDRYHVEGELEAKLNELSMGLVVWSPLAGGVLTGKYNDGIPDDSRGAAYQDSDSTMAENFSLHRLEKVRQLTDLAAEYDYTMPALALAWAMDHPNVDSVITGATKPEHVEANLAALDVEMTAELETQIEAILNNRPHNSARRPAPVSELPAL